jgi:YggT family protein
MGHLIIALANILNLVLTIYMWLIIGRAVLSWVNPDPYNPIVRFIRNVTEPVLYRIRSMVPLFFGGIDFSPMIALLAILFLRTLVVQNLYYFGTSLLGVR